MDGNFIGKEKNFAEEFHLRCFFCPLHFLLLVTRFLDAQLKEEARENSIIPYFTRLRVITGLFTKKISFKDHE